MALRAILTARKDRRALEVDEAIAVLAIEEAGA